MSTHKYSEEIQRIEKQLSDNKPLSNDDKELLKAIKGSPFLKANLALAFKRFEIYFDRLPKVHDDDFDIEDVVFYNLN